MPSIKHVEAKTLLLRSLFPVHPLAAAIQSIEVCRRDLEGNKSIGLGRIIFPAVLLHGAFDFVVMLMALVIGIRHVGEKTQNDDIKIEETPADKRLEYGSLAVGFVMVLIGILYYVKESRSQKKRLEEMEVDPRRDESELPLVV